MDISLIARYLLVSLCFFALTAQCRPFEYTKLTNYYEISQISAVPAPAPTASGNVPDSSTFYNVLSYGAVGNGVADDTQAFKMAWDAACQTDSSTFLVPRHHIFMIQSTIFTGPCKSGLVFQVKKAKSC